jgi:hypothetical protein
MGVGTVVLMAVVGSRFEVMTILVVTGKVTVGVATMAAVPSVTTATVGLGEECHPRDTALHHRHSTLGHMLVQTDHILGQMCHITRIVHLPLCADISHVQSLTSIIRVCWVLDAGYWVLGTGYSSSYSSKLG